jgi:hypothetical protein
LEARDLVSHLVVYESGNRLSAAEVGHDGDMHPPMYHITNISTGTTAHLLSDIRKRSISAAPYQTCIPVIQMYCLMNRIPTSRPSHSFNPIDLIPAGYSASNLNA